MFRPGPFGILLGCTELTTSSYPSYTTSTLILLVYTELIASYAAYTPFLDMFDLVPLDILGYTQS